MARRREAGWGRAGGGRVRSFGLVLALFALLCQSLVLLVPQPAIAMPAPATLPADAALFTGGYLLCQDEDTPASDTDKAPCQHCLDCPLCQAVHLGGGLVPPTLSALPVPTVRAIAFVRRPPAMAPQRLAARAHLARAPPLVSSL